jgi:ribosome assembly protein YihI (activator of Der GTPase)
MEWKEMIGKYFFFKLKSGGYNSGTIQYVDEKFDRKIEIIDKFGMQVGFNE